MNGASANTDLIRKKMDEYAQKRIAAQPQGVRTCGSLFKNPSGAAAGKLIDDAGWRGREINGAKMFEKHANFLVNAGASSAKDLEDFATMIQRDVKSKSGIELDWEIKRYGEY
jgi:UDP-N-acetylmuramate dehydrogenase